MTSAAEFILASHSLRALREAAAGCRGCPLWEGATQTVLGERPRKARLMLVGEQPADREEAMAALLDDLRRVAAAIDDAG